MAGFESRNTEALWAIRDLEEFSSTPWNDDAVLMPADVISRVREATEVLSRVVLDGVFVEDVEHITEIEALRESRHGDQEEIESLKETLKASRKTVRQLERHKLAMGITIGKTAEKLSEVEIYGGEQAFPDIIAELNHVLAETKYDEALLSHEIENSRPGDEE
jgi:hypothetical protein